LLHAENNYKFSLIVVLLCIINCCYGQSNARRLADRLYEAKNFLKGGQLYIKAVKENEFNARKKGMYYNAASEPSIYDCVFLLSLGSRLMRLYIINCW